MKINDINRVGAVNPYRKQMTAGHAGQTDRKNKVQDGVQFSEEALRLLESQGASAADPARTDRVAELKEAVSTGTYKVDAGKIAEKLLPYLRG